MYKSPKLLNRKNNTAGARACFVGTCVRRTRRTRLRRFNATDSRAGTRPPQPIVIQTYYARVDNNNTRQRYGTRCENDGGDWRRRGSPGARVSSPHAVRPRVMYGGLTDGRTDGRPAVRVVTVPREQCEFSIMRRDALIPFTPGLRKGGRDRSDLQSWGLTSQGAQPPPRKQSYGCIFEQHTTIGTWNNFEI